MIKAIGIICLFVGFCGISFEKIREEKEKINVFKEMRNFAEYLVKEIEYSHIPIPDICKEYRSRSEDDFGVFLEQVCFKYENHSGKSFEQIWAMETENYKGHKEEKVSLKNLGKCFGFSNIGHQLASINRYLYEMENKLLQNEKKFQDNKKLILYFGVMSGLLLSIILL